MQLPWISILILVLFGYFTQAKKFSVAAYFYVLPFFAELLQLEVGPVSAPLWTFFSLLVVLTSRKSEILTKHKKLLLSLMKPLILFLVISILMFAFIGPLLLFNAFPEGDERAWSQQYIGRACISSVRFLLQLLSICATCIVFGRIAPKDTINILSYVGITSALYGLVNLVSHGLLNSILFPSSRLDLSDRLIAMNGEPRVFGQSMAVLAIILFIDFFHHDSSRSLILFCVFSLLVLASASATSTVALAAGVTFIILTNIKLKKINKISQLILILFTITPAISYIFNNLLSDSALSEQMSDKLLSVFTGKERYDLTGLATDNDAFDFFKRLEVFDRAAMNFMVYNPVFLLTGVGPNTVSIPSSSYIDSVGATIYKDGIDSVPFSGLINTFTWSGLIGLFMILNFYLKLYRLASMSKYAYDLSKAALIIFILVYPPSWWLLIGYIASIIIHHHQTVIYNADNCYSHVK